MEKIKKVLILLLIAIFFSQDSGFCVSNRDFGLRPPMYFNKLMQEALNEKSAQGFSKEDVLVDEEIEFSKAEIRDHTAFNRKVSKLFDKINLGDWPSPPISSPEANAAIESIVELRQQRILRGDTFVLTFFEKNDKGGTERKEIWVDSPEGLDWLRNRTRGTSFTKTVGEILSNAYDTCVRRMLGNPNKGGGRIETGKIRLVVSIREKNLVIRVIDNGEGVERHYGTRPVFYTHYGSDYENLLVGGQGIGIPLVQTVMKYHGGTVEWHGPSGYPEGFGTEVIMTFPIDNELFEREHPNLFSKPNLMFSGKENDKAERMASQQLLELERMCHTESNVPVAKWDNVFRNFAKLPESNRQRVVLIIERADFEKPYAYEVYLPRRLSEEAYRVIVRRLGEKIISMVTGLVGGCSFKIYTQDVQLFRDLTEQWEREDLIRKYIKTIYGDVNIKWADAGDIPSQLFSLPKGVALKRSVGMEFNESDLFIGIDFGRSDVKFYLIDGNGKKLTGFSKNWWTIIDKTAKDVNDPKQLVSAEEHIRVFVEGVKELLMNANQEGKLPEGYKICGIGLSAAAVIYRGEIRGISETFAGVNEEEVARLVRPLISIIAERMEGFVSMAEDVTLEIYNDGDAAAAFSIINREQPPSTDVVVHISLGTGVAGSVEIEGTVSPMLAELGKIVVDTSYDDNLPYHDKIGIRGVGQSLAGSQRNFIYLLRRFIKEKGGFRTFTIDSDLTQSGVQRQALKQIQKAYGELKSRQLRLTPEEAQDLRNIESLFVRMGEFFAEFLIATSDYLRKEEFSVSLVGKCVEGETGVILVKSAQSYLAKNYPGYTIHFSLAEEAVLGQAQAMADLVRIKRGLQLQETAAQSLISQAERRCL